MVFTSIPVYLDPPNWQQQQPNNNQQGIGIDQQQQLQQQQHQQQQQQHSQNHSQLLQPPLQLQTPNPVGGGTGGVGASSIRPGSMADRARQAKLPQPEQQLKCPRCDSSNTKFCYFNNYSLTQPRHFCKTCRRYWTRGGALRNVPVGGGCRRNKRSKSTSSKSPGNSEQRQSHSSTTSSSIPSSSTNYNTSDHNNLLSHHMMSTTPQSQPRPHIPFMSSLHQFTDHYGSAPGLGLNFSGIQTPSTGQHGGTIGHMDFQMGNGSSGGSGNVLSSTGGIEQWRLQQMQQFPFLGGMEPPQPGMYPYQGSVENINQLLRTSRPTAGSLASSVKMEENQAAGLHLSRQFMGNNTSTNSNNSSQGNDNQYNWGGGDAGGGGGGGNAAWTDLSGFNSSSTTHIL